MLVLDASTLILLAKAEILDRFLGSSRGRVLIPAVVAQECGAKESLDALLITKAITEKRILVRVLKERRVYRKIRGDFGLGKGEAAAIALALSAKASLVGIDDRNGINACKLLRLPFTTAINILVRMRDKRLVEKVAALRALEALARYGRYTTTIIQDARSLLESRP